MVLAVPTLAECDIISKDPQSKIKAKVSCGTAKNQGIDDIQSNPNTHLAVLQVHEMPVSKWKCSMHNNNLCFVGMDDGKNIHRRLGQTDLVSWSMAIICLSSKP